MLKFLRLFIVGALIAFVPVSSQALEPQDALSARAEKSAYVVARVDNLGGALKEIFSISNIEMFASLVAPEEAQALRLFAGLASQVPAKSVALASGVTPDATPFFQIAVSYPDSFKSKLELVASGKATREDLAALILGNSGAAFAYNIQFETLDGESGKYYLLFDTVFLSAKDDLLLLSMSKADLDESFAALGTAKKRLVIKRRFVAPNYKFIHIDMSALASVIPEDDQDLNFKNTLKLFKAPIDIEFAFESKPGKFTASFAINALESIVGVDDFVKTAKTTKHGEMFIAGSGRPYIGFSGSFKFDKSNLDLYPEYAQIWNSFTDELSKIGIDKTDVKNLLEGNILFAASGKASLMGQSIPGVYFTITGRNGAAEKILGKILGNEKFTSSVPLAPLKVKGWDDSYQVDPGIAPVSLAFGRKGETLFFGVINPDELGKKPDFTPEVADIMKRDLFSVGFVDVSEIWKYLRTAISDNGSLRAHINTLEPAYIQAMDDILDADVFISLIKLWAPSAETGIVELSLSDVSEEKRFLPRVINAIANIDKAKNSFNDDNGVESEDDSTGKE
ncbi:hypothetical protein AGMMS50276_06380 [Synergistales bacterium]|nr:hypothetical protein AGMMS50276_06380 [Synergistales bacterium]